MRNLVPFLIQELYTKKEKTQHSCVRRSYCKNPTSLSSTFISDYSHVTQEYELHMSGYAFTTILLMVQLIFQPAAKNSLKIVD